MQPTTVTRIRYGAVANAGTVATEGYIDQFDSTINARGVFDSATRAIGNIPGD